MVVVIAFLLCLPAAAIFYIVMSQDVVAVAMYLKCMHACVGRDQRLSFMLLAIPTEASASVL